MPEVAQSLEDLQAEVARLKASIARANASTLRFKVSDKGAVSVYGLGRFPVTLYGSQWTRLFAASDSLQAFMLEQADRLATKD